MVILCLLQFSLFPAGIYIVEIDDIAEFYYWTRKAVTMVTPSNDSDLVVYVSKYYAYIGILKYNITFNRYST